MTSHPRDTALGAARDFLDRALHLSQHHIFRQSRKTGLSFSQLALLRRIYWHGESSASELSGFLGVSNAALSQAADRLVDMELMERVEDPHDRRVKIHRISPKGRMLLEQIHSGRYDWLPGLLEDKSDDELNTIIRAFILLELPEENHCDKNR